MNNDRINNRRSVTPLRGARGIQGSVMLKIQAKKLDRVTVLSLEGHVVTGETDILRDTFDSLAQAGTLIIDLGRVTAIDAHGLGVLLQLRERTNASATRLKLMNVSKPMRRIFEITRLDSVFELIPRVEFFPTVSPERRTTVVALKSCA